MAKTHKGAPAPKPKNFKERLKADVSDLDDQRAERLARVGTNASKQFVDNLIKERDALEERLSELNEMTAKNDLNQGLRPLKNEEMEQRIKDIHEAEQRLVILNQKIAIAERIHEAQLV